MYLAVRTVQSDIESHMIKLLSWASKKLRLERAVYLRGRPWLRNAQATICGDVIEADLAWVATLPPRYGWGSVAFLAFHEVGHLYDCGVRTPRERELFADEVAGWLLRQAEIPLKDAIRLLRTEGACTICGNHPPAEERVWALRRGYGILADVADQIRQLFS
jgi:hypothetical protein